VDRLRAARGAAVRASIAVLGASLLTWGCASPPPPPVAELASGALGYLVDGTTTRAEVVLKLGLPARTFEGDRIALYRLAWSADDGLRPLAWHAPLLAAYDLVLVFDAGGVVEQHALVAK
jgi:hypothetical protein